MKKNYFVTCPKCHGMRYRVIARKRGFSFDKAANGAILGELLGHDAFGLGLLAGIDGKVTKTYLQCENPRCRHVWFER